MAFRNKLHFSALILFVYRFLEKGISENTESEKTKQIITTKNVQIHILYWTALGENTKLVFRDNIYSLDADLYQKL
jgi:murein L,D-transpeptidase YcbB/YkuD